MIISRLNELFKKTYNNLGIQIEPKIIASNREDLCDYQCDDAFKLAKDMHMSPIDIGNKIIEDLQKNSEYHKIIEDAEVYTPGFINIKISKELINDALNKMNIPHFGLKTDSPKKIFFDYGGPNMAKPLHVGHSRSPIIGEAIKRMYAYLGNEVISDIHLGDTGLQIGQVLYAIQRDNIKIEDITLGYLDKVYPEISGLCKTDAEVKAKCEELTFRLQKGEEELERYFEAISKISVGEIKRIYDYLDIHFDTWEGEHSALKYVDKVENILKDKGLLKESEGALIVDVANDEDKKPMPPLLFKKSNGACIYATTDLASIEQRVENFDPEYFIYLADLRQALHFEQVFRTVKLSNLTNASFEFCGFGTVNGPDGKPFKTRAGDTPKLWDLLQEIKANFVALKAENSQMEQIDLDKIVTGILKFADLQNFREKDYIFDIDKFSKVVGKTGPYIMYTYLRINKVIDNNLIKELDDTITNDSDRRLRIKILQLKDIFDSAIKHNAPDIIANYLYNLCVLSNAFYENNRLNEASEETKTQWVSLLNISNRIILDLSNILGLQMPSKM